MWHNVVWYTIINISEHPTDPVFYSEDGGHWFVQNAYTFVPGFRASPNLQIRSRYDLRPHTQDLPWSDLQLSFVVANRFDHFPCALHGPPGTSLFPRSCSPIAIAKRQDCCQQWIIFFFLGNLEDTVEWWAYLPHILDALESNLGRETDHPKIQSEPDTIRQFWSLITNQSNNTPFVVDRWQHHTVCWERGQYSAYLARIEETSWAKELPNWVLSTLYCGV
jgi:hypothetical protein